jgi:membrane-associated phospholipid phosphatase
MNEPTIAEPNVPSRPLWWRLAAWLQPPYLALLAFGGLLLGLRHFYRRPILEMVYPTPIAKYHLSVKYALYLLGVFSSACLLRHIRLLVSGDARSRWRGLRDALRMIGDFMPYILLIWVYENLHDLTYLIRPDTMDHLLSRADQYLFGVQPTLWLQRWMNPVLTDYLDLAYMTYFLFPFLIGGWLYFNGNVHAFRELQLSLIVAFYCGFLGYITVPAVGPQHILAGQYTVPLRGFFLHWHVDKVIHKMQSFPRDCFPSMHTAASSVTLFYFWRYRRELPLRAFVLTVVTLLTASLWFSTVYLRYHWFVDVVAGWILSGFAAFVGVTLLRVWPSRIRRESSPIARGTVAGDEH